jgi:putative pyruvate formate lyase activating enzyme
MNSFREADVITPSLRIDANRLACAGEHDRRCRLCERRCGVDRMAGQAGFCRATTEARVYRQRVEWGEEVELIPSHLFYLSGCNLRCAFCIGESEAFDPRCGRPLEASFLAETLAAGRAAGARNLQWVGGEPTIHLPALLRTMAAGGPLPRVVWKSNFFGTPESFALLEGLVDVYVADFKFGNDACARRIAGVEGYLATVTRNLALAAGRARLIVRHLLLPGHQECCYRRIVDWLGRNLPETPLSLVEGYLPRWNASRFEELSAPLPAGEALRARALATEAGLNVIR